MHGHLNVKCEIFVSHQILAKTMTLQNDKRHYCIRMDYNNTTLWKCAIISKKLVTYLSRKYSIKLQRNVNRYIILRPCSASIICAKSHIPSSLNGNIPPQVSGSEILCKEITGRYETKASSHHNFSFTAGKLVFNPYRTNVENRVSS